MEYREKLTGCLKYELPPVRSASRSPAKGRLLPVKPAQQLLNSDTVIAGNALQDTLQRLRPDRIVQWDHLMVLATFAGRNAHVRTALTHLLTTHPA